MEKTCNEAKNAFEKQCLEYHPAKNGGALAKTAEAIGVFPGNLHVKRRKAGLIERELVPRLKFWNSFGRFGFAGRSALGEPHVFGEG
ncbi:MAG: hypothetical protein LBL31_06205 [Spirochaetaceae bacterium]|nr:hypothetical protein [Spirochaetaceae bacterium]